MVYYAVDISYPNRYNSKQMVLNIPLIGIIIVLSVFNIWLTVDRFG
jgi:hypothetical protein